MYEIKQTYFFKEKLKEIVEWYDRVQWLGLPRGPRHSRITRRNGAFPHKNSASYARIRFLMKSDVHTAEPFCQDCTDMSFPLV